MARLSRSRLFVLGFLFLFPISPASMPAKPRLRIVFTGICDFVPQPDGSMRVVMPDASQGMGEEQMEHKAFVRVVEKDVVLKGGPPGDEPDKDYRIWIVQGQTIELTGPFETAGLEVSPTFEKLVPDMTKLGVSLSHDYLKASLAAQMVLSAGTLSASPHQRNSSHAFAAKGKQPSADECKKAKPMAGHVQIALALQKDAKDKTFVLQWGKAKATFAYQSGSDIEVRIGNLTKKDRHSGDIVVPTEQQDTDFLFHYNLATQPVKTEKLIPTVCEPVIKGSWFNCYAARWGDLQKSRRQ